MKKLSSILTLLFLFTLSAEAKREKTITVNNIKYKYAGETKTDYYGKSSFKDVFVRLKVSLVDFGFSQKKGYDRIREVQNGIRQRFANKSCQSENTIVITPYKLVEKYEVREEGQYYNCYKMVYTKH